jgi:hypothetical protein
LTLSYAPSWQQPVPARHSANARWRRCRRSASLGLFDVLAVGPVDVRLVEVKAGGE